MKRLLALAVTLTVVGSGCGSYEAWSKRREARALEKNIEKQQQALKKMSPSALEQAEAESREKAIAQYEKILKEYSDVGRDEMDESLYLLGRLLFEREQQDFQRAQQGFEFSRQQAEAAGRSAGEEPKPRYPQAKAVFERLLKDFPQSAFREDALYDLAYIRTEEGDRAGGAELFQTLIKEKPSGRYAAEIHFRLAENAFESFRLADAEEHYRAVVKAGPADLVDKSLFKLGWVYYNLDRYDEAKQVLAEVLRRQSARMEKEGREFAPAPILFFPGPRRAAIDALQEREGKGNDLYQETLEIIARVYADAGGADALATYLRAEQHGPTPPRYAAPLMHRLALVQKERSSFDAAARSYELLLATFPTFKDAPKIELELVDVLVGQKKMDEAARVREAMLAKYDTGSPWARANPEQEVRDAAMAEARKGLEWSIQYYHARALEIQKDQPNAVPAELRSAIRLYEHYLKRFPEGEPSYDQRFRYAQALYSAAEYGRAADVFRDVSIDKNFAKNREQASLSRVLSVEKLSEGQQPPLPPTVIDGLVAAYEDYIKLNPASDKNPALLFKEGKLYFDAGKFAAAIAAYERLIKNHPADPLAAEANDLIAQSHFRLGDYAAAERWSEKALAVAGPSNPLGARRGEVEKLYALTLFKQAEKADDEKQYKEASKDYLRIVDRLPQSEIAAKALYNAANAADHAKDKDSAAALYERLLDDYPTSDLGPDAAVKLAEFYKDKASGGPDRIISIYERVADAHVENPKSEEFLFLAGKLAAKEKRQPETIRLFEKFLSRYHGQGSREHAQRSVEAFYHLGTTYAAMGSASAARQYLEQFLSESRGAASSFGEGGEGLAYAVANANLLLASGVASEYHAARIEAPMAETLKRKEALLNTLVERYAPAVASGLSPIATQASYGIGNAYEEFGSALEEAPRPPGLSAEERAEYDRLLEDKIRPYLKKAVEAYRATVRGTRDKQLDDEWVKRSRERLAAVAPRAFARPPRPGFQRLPAASDPPPGFVATFDGKPVSPDSGPGFLGSLVADESETRLREFAKGLAAAESQNFAEAYEKFAAAAKGGPAEAAYDAAVAALRQGNNTQALSMLDEALRRQPDFSPAITLSARLLEASGRRDQAAAAYRKAVDSPKATGADRVALARFLEKQNQSAEALAVYQAALAADSMNGEAALGVARLSPDQGGEGLDRLLGPLGRSATGLVDLGILAAERGQPRTAVQAFAAARAALPPGDKSGQAIVLMDQAAASMAAGDLDAAASLLASAAQADPASPGVGNGAAVLAMRRGSFLDAEAELKKVVQASPSYGAAWANLGILNELYLGSPEQAIECYNRYLATHPADESLVSAWIQEIREGNHGNKG